MRIDPLDAECLSGVCRGVGVVLAMAGSVLAAPDATVALLRRWEGRWRTAATRIRGLFAVWLPFLRRKVTIEADVRAVAGVAAASASAGSASLHLWSPSAPVDEKIEMLMQRVLDLEGDLNTVRLQQRSDVARLESRQEDLNVQFDREVEQVRETLRHKEKKAVAIDGRALPVIAAGVVLSGIPDELSRCWWVGWTAVAGALWLLHRRILSVLRERRS